MDHDQRFGPYEKLTPRRHREHREHREQPFIPSPLTSFVLFVPLVEEEGLEVTKWLILVADIGAERSPNKDDNTPPAFILGGMVFPVTDNVALDVGIKGGLTEPEADYAILAGPTLAFWLTAGPRGRQPRRSTESRALLVKKERVFSVFSVNSVVNPSDKLECGRRCRPFNSHPPGRGWCSWH